jgi:hypothetical protein
MGLARITLVKKKIAREIKWLLKDFAVESVFDSPLSLTETDIPCLVVTSSGESSFEEEHGVLKVTSMITVDIYLKNTRVPDQDKLCENVILSILQDKSCDGLVQNISIKETSQKNIKGSEPIHILLFDFEVEYHLELPNE